MVIVTRNAERGFFTTTRKVHAIVVSLAKLFHLFDPIGIFVIVIIVSRITGKIHQLHNARSVIALFGVEVGFFQHHRILITIQHTHTLRLPRARETIAEVDTRLTTLTATCCNFNHTIGTTSTPNGCRSSIFKHFNACDVFGADLEKRCKLLRIFSIAIIEIRLVKVLKDITITYNEWFLRAIDGADTAQTHRGTRTEVTRIGYNVQTGNLSLQSLTGRFKSKAFHVIHIEGLRCS